MSAYWVTLDKFEELTGVNRETTRKKCKAGHYPEGLAWRKISPKIYCINMDWWNQQCLVTGSASKSYQKAASKLNFNMAELDAVRGLNATQIAQLSPSPLLPDLE